MPNDGVVTQNSVVRLLKVIDTNQREAQKDGGPPAAQAHHTRAQQAEDQQHHRGNERCVAHGINLIKFVQHARSSLTDGGLFIRVKFGGEFGLGER